MVKKFDIGEMEKKQITLFGTSIYQLVEMNHCTIHVTANKNISPICIE